MGSLSEAARVFDRHLLNPLVNSVPNTIEASWERSLAFSSSLARRRWERAGVRAHFVVILQVSTSEIPDLASKRSSPNSMPRMHVGGLPGASLPKARRIR